MLLAGVWLLLSGSVASAQVAVVEVGANLYQNTITAVEAVLQTANMILELTPVDDLIVAGGIAEDMALLADIWSQASGLSYDLSSLNTQITVLFDLDTAPDTREGLDARLRELKRVSFEVRTFALRTQTLAQTVLRTVDHLLGLLDSIGALVGNMQGNQRMLEAHSTVAKTLAVMDTHTATFHRMETTDKMTEALILESIRRMECRRLEGWPGMEGLLQCE